MIATAGADNCIYVLDIEKDEVLYKHDGIKGNLNFITIKFWQAHSSMFIIRNVNKLSVILYLTLF